MKHNKKNTLLWLSRINRGECSIRFAASQANYSVHRMWELKNLYAEIGAACLENKNKGRTPKNKKSPETRKKIIELYLKDYEGYNFSFFRDILEEDFNIKVSYRTLYNILTEFGIKSPEKRRVKKAEKNHRIRPRKEHEGEMLQIDGTPFAWFKWCGDNKKYCISAAVDDATSKLMGAYMTENECLYGYMEMLRRIYIREGAPASFYSDRAGIFCVSPRDKDKLTIAEQLQGLHEKRTQWQRILEEMNIKQILAFSPQAKGRVERMWLTVQKRLPHYFKKYKIHNMAEANEFLETKFLDIYNAKFARPPQSLTKFYARNNDDDLSDILCARFPCISDINGQFKFMRATFGIIGAKYTARKNFELCISENGLKAYLNGKYYDVEFRSELVDARGETMPIVVKNIIYENLMRPMKEKSA